MKKRWYVVIILLSAGVIGANMEEEPVTKEEPKTKEVVKKEEPVKKKEPAPKPAPEPKVEIEYAYLDSMSEGMEHLSDGLGSITEQTQKFASNPALRHDNDWLIDTALALSLLDDSIAEIRGIKEPTNPELKKAHVLILKAMDHYQFNVDNFPDAIDNMDVALLEECTTNITQATGYIQEASSIMAKYNEDMEDEL